MWNLKGELIHAHINFPGSWHDSRIVVSSVIYTLRFRTKKQLLRVICHLYNFRAHYVGLNQIRTTYASGGSDEQPWFHDYLIRGRDEDDLAEWF